MRGHILGGLAVLVLSAGAAAAWVMRDPEGGAHAAPACHAPGGQVTVTAGTVALGQDGGAPQTVSVPAFDIDRREVSNADFAAFVRATGHVTQAEREGRSVVFSPPKSIDAAADASQWWRFVKGADWRRPDGPASTLEGRMNAPVVHVAYADALAYAHWKGRALPSEAQWERAARGGVTGRIPDTSWAYDKKGRPIANTWQGVFPVKDELTDGQSRPAASGCFPPNGYGLYDMIGNVWEWTDSPAPGPTEARLIKGGSYLCAFNYCASYRPAARQVQELDLGAGHVGFRTVSG